jgi:hypothetical protein
MDNERIKVLIVYRPNFRSTLWTQFYRYCRSHPTKDIEYELLHDTFGGWQGREDLSQFDVIVSGVRANGTINQMGENDWQKFVYHVCDIENVFGNGLFPARADNERYLASVNWDAVWWDGSKLCESAMERLSDGMQDHPCVRESEVWCIPHAIDMDQYRSARAYASRDVDVLALWTVDTSSPYHMYRQILSEALSKHSVRQYADDKTGEFKQKLMFNYFRGTIPTPNRYKDMLGRAYFGLADTSGRGAMTAKYLELAAAGAVVVGEQPEGYDYLFDDGRTFIRLDYNNLPQTFESFMKDWLLCRAERMDEIQAMNLRMCERIEKYHSPVVIKAQLDEKILGLVRA